MPYQFQFLLAWVVIWGVGFVLNLTLGGRALGPEESMALAFAMTYFSIEEGKRK